MKVLHLPYGEQMTVLSPALRKLGIESTSVHFWQSKLGFHPDYCLNLQQFNQEEWEQKRREFFYQAAEEYDVFHFYFGETFLPDHSDLSVLKKMNKKLVVSHLGSDVRILQLAQRNGNPYVRVKTGKNRSEQKIIDHLLRLSSYIDHAVIPDYELLPYVAPYYKNVHMIRQAIELTKFDPAYPISSDVPPEFVHAPSHSFIKGTAYVWEAIERLKKKKFEFTFKTIERVPHDEALLAYRRADIVIDQLLIGSHGLLSLEAMAFGKPAMCFIYKEIRQTYPKDLPIISANPETLYHKLKMMLKHRDKWREIGKKGRKYVARYHDSSIIAAELANLYQSI